MVKGARPVQRDEAESEDAESHELVHPAGRLRQQNYQCDRASKPPTRWVSPLTGSRNLLLIPRLMSLPAGNYTRTLCITPAIDVLPGDRIIYATGSYEGAWQSGRMRWS
jgi:hypothetical protein